MFDRTLCSMIATTAIVFGLMTVAWADSTGTTATDDIKSLMIQRRDTLRERVKAVQEQFRTGRTSIDRVLAAENEALDAELELVETKGQRIMLRKKVLANFEQIEQFAELNVKNGTGMIQEQLAAKAARLAAKIALLREQATD